MGKKNKDKKKKKEKDDEPPAGNSANGFVQHRSLFYNSFSP